MNASNDYDSWDIKTQRTEFFVILGHFSPLDPPNNRKNGKKMHPDIIILHLSTTNGDHKMYGSWNMEHDRHFCHFGPFFLHFYPLTTHNIKILKKWKQCLEMSFYKSVPKIMIIYYTVPEIWHVMELLLFILGYFLTF